MGGSPLSDQAFRRVSLNTASNMKQELIGLPQRYLVALRKYLKQGPRASLQPALELGRQAVALGLETLELARIHERALATLELSDGADGLIKRAEVFFAEANTPIVETHYAARAGGKQLNQLNETLSRRRLELAATNRELQRGVVRHKKAEAVLKKNDEHFGQLLKDSLLQQESLRQLTHRNLSAQEKERLTISHLLQDEIAQTLLSIHVRLLNLRTAAKSNRTDLAKEISQTRRLVEQSIQSINRFARKLDIPRNAASDRSVAPP
jgi:signal transduction histidine kinase